MQRSLAKTTRIKPRKTREFEQLNNNITWKKYEIRKEVNDLFYVINTNNNLTNEKLAYF